jgi:hypothetical protein
VASGDDNYALGGKKEPVPTVFESSRGPVEIKVLDATYQPSDAWLTAQKRQSEAGGPYASETVQERILELVKAFRTFEYDRYATPVKYAREWGYSVRYVRQLCAEALKIVREEVTDPEYVTVTVCEALDKVIRDNIKSPKVGNQKLVVQAAKVWSEIAGVRAPVEVRLSRGDNDLPSDPNELRKLAAALAAAPGSSLRDLRLSQFSGEGDATALTDSGEGGATVAGEEPDRDGPR